MFTERPPSARRRQNLTTMHSSSVPLLLAARALRGFADGYVAILLPAYLLALGFGTWEVGVLSTTTLLGSALMTLAVGAMGHRFHHRLLLTSAALLMAATGFAFALVGGAAGTLFWPLLLIAFIGTLNPSSGDVSVFLPLEHARLAEASDASSRTALFARYSLVGAMFAALGALATSLPAHLSTAMDASQFRGIQAMFALYGLIGCIVFLLYRTMPPPVAGEAIVSTAPLGPSRSVVVRLATLFSMDSFAGGLVVNSLLALWLFERFGLSLAETGHFFWLSGLAGAASQLAAPVLARRIGLVNTMVFTHIPASLFLIGAACSPRLDLALGLLLMRSLMSQMDVPARSALVMTLVTPGERAAAASFTTVPRSLAAALSPALGGALFAAGWLAAPLILCGALKIGYDLVLWRGFRRAEANASQ